MNKKGQKKKRIKKKRKRKQVSLAIYEYYHFAFLKLHEQLWHNKEEFYPSPKRKSFWNVVLPGIYFSQNAFKLLQLYHKELEKELALRLPRHSIAYWLHAYRRLSPGSIGCQTNSYDIYWTRAILEAAIQKYGQFESCSGVGISNEVKPIEILNGLILDKEIPKNLRDSIIQHLKENPQLVLLKFGLEELRELYKLEALAHEIWLTVAKMRIVGKGAPLIIDPNSEEIIIDGRSEELNKLVSIFDERQHAFDASATGTVFIKSFDDTSESGVYIIPSYNINNIPGEEFNELLSNLFNASIEVNGDFSFNFIWSIFQLKDYYEAHAPFSVGFFKKYGISLESFIVVLGALLHQALPIKTKDKTEAYLHWYRCWQRAYVIKNSIKEEIESLIPKVIEHLGLEIDKNDVDIQNTLSILKLTEKTRKNIDLVTHGPHCMLLPMGQDKICIDYAWIIRMLYNLFYEVKIDDQRFKGTILENLVQSKDSTLPRGRCKAFDESTKQIDAAFPIGNTLLIVECKAKGKSFGFFRGDEKAINFRNEFIRDSLTSVDSKAKWLASNPCGKNYDIRKFKHIVPVVVTPFPEYIPSLDTWFWLEDRIPRVLTPRELKQKISDGTMEKVSKTTLNKFRIKK